MPILEIRELKKSYRTPDGGYLPILDIGHLTIADGGQVALQGRSGQGKTTLLNMIAGILTADSGEVLIDGVSMTALGEAGRDRLRARALGYVFQTFNLLQGYSALENVLLGMMFNGRTNETEARELLERVGLGHRMHYRPSRLSAGQQQRVAVARALAGRPRLVLADEPTGNLDVQHGREALILMREACRERGAALLLVSHDPAVLETFDIRLDLGELNRVRHDVIAALETIA